MNYQTKLDTLLSTFSSSVNNKPKLLLHACCGPCSSYVLEYLSQYFDITVYFYNPNIYPQAEYSRRLQELKEFYMKFPPVVQHKIHLVEENYDPEEFYVAVGTRENQDLIKEKEKGERCRRCYEFRLKKTFDYALIHDFNYFCTTLSISPFKDAQKINIIGEDLVNKEIQQREQSFSKIDIKSSSIVKIPLWLPSDFKKNNGFKRSLEISQEYDLYRQEYCGCVYSIK